MKKLVLGSLNIDRTYRVESLVKPKETIAALAYESFCGGKGFNQAIALSRAGSEVYFAGVIGHDGTPFIEALNKDNIKTELIKQSENSNGHAVIQVDEEGQNSITIVSGSNAEITEAYIDEVLAHFKAGDLIVLQNEITCVDYAIRRAKERGLFVAFNPSPMNDSIKACDLSLVDYLVVNEIEGASLCGSEEPAEILRRLHKSYPNTSVLLTMGENGSIYMDKSGARYAERAILCEAVDTTAAGDTFTGYFLDGIFKEMDPAEALLVAAIASGISVTRKGASPSIPTFDEVRLFSETQGCKIRRQH